MRVRPVVHRAMERFALRVLNLAISTWHWTHIKAMAPMPIDRLGAYSVAALMLCGLCLLQDFPLRLPGLAIGLLGAGAVVVAVRTDSLTKWEKIGWTCVAFLLLFVEVRTLYKDREEQNASFTSARLAEQRNFDQTAREFNTTIAEAQRHFDATMAKSDKLLGLSKESLDNITGGDSYAWIAAGMGPQGPPFQLMVWVKGKHGVHNVAAEIQTILGGTDRDTMMRQFQSIHALPLGNGEFLPGPTPINESIGSGRYVLTIVSRNQWVTEQLDIAQCGDGQWSDAIKMNGVAQKENSKWKGRPGCNRPFPP